MKNILLTSLTTILSVALVGCDSSDIENKPSDFICFNAENQFIDGSTGFTSVALFEYGERIDIGYSHQGSLVNHSECAPALIETTGLETTFSWYEYGNLIENDGVTSLRFFNKNNLVNIEAQRIKAPGVADQEFSERDTDYDSPAHITKRVWNTETPNMVVTAVDNFDGIDERSTTAVIGTSTKKKTWDANGAQWDCSYTTVSNGNFIDFGCTNEQANDIQYIGFELDLDVYFDSLSDSINYETEPEEIWEDVDHYR